MRDRQFRVAEIFGPTIQGEGRNVGMPCHFIRFGGCDFRCEWCDTPHAVLPDQVAKLPQMDKWGIYAAITDLGRGTRSSKVNWIVLTGGNPGLLNLDNLIDTLHEGGYKIMLETQGTTYRQWYTQVDDLCFSPKPPSSGNTSDLDLLDKILTRYMEDASEKAAYGSNTLFLLPYLKVPVFTDDDLDFAEDVHTRFSDLEFFLSIGNVDPLLPTVGNPEPEVMTGIPLTRDIVLDSFRGIVEHVLESRPLLQDVRIFPQQHTLLWGNERGR